MSLHPWGMVGAAVLFTLGLTPSLLPRDWFYQGLVSGLGAGIGYGLGTAAHWVWRRLPVRAMDVRPRTRTLLGWVSGVAAVAWLAGMVVFARRWQVGIAELTGAEAPGLWTFLLVLPVGLALFVVVVGAGRLLRWLARRIGARLPERVTPTARGVTAWAVVLLLVGWLTEQIIPGTLVAGAERVFSVTNSRPADDHPAPTAPERSGSPDSHIDYATVGNYGGRFLNQGLGAEELTETLNRPAQEPIRLYAGLASASTDSGRAHLIIDELERTAAVEREAILIVMTTGTGWVNHRAAQAFEMLYAGDTAIVAEQYSTVPSAYHFLAGGEAVSTAGREFITPIVDWWNDLSEERRPRLYLYGESLGSAGVESAFSGMRDVANSVDGILLTGPPNFSPLWSDLVERRDPGSPEVRPEHSAAPVVRFANRPEDIRSWYGSQPDDLWGPTRMLYVQHPSDPVTWWSPELILREPDWLKEPAGFDRLPAMTWMPFITFLQVSADLPVSQNVPQGHGHNYGDAMLDGFAAIAGPGRFTVGEVDGLREAYRAVVEAQEV